MSSGLQMWFWNVRFQTDTVLAVLRSHLVLLIGQHRGAVVTALVLLGLVAAAFVIVFVIAWSIGTVADQSKSVATCPHGRPLGQRTKNFCAECAMEKSAADDIHARLRARRARRALGEDV